MCPLHRAYLALLQRSVLLGVAVAVAYYFPNGAPLSGSDPLPLCRTNGFYPMIVNRLEGTPKFA